MAVISLLEIIKEKFYYIDSIILRPLEVVLLNAELLTMVKILGRVRVR